MIKKRRDKRNRFGKACSTSSSVWNNIGYQFCMHFGTGSSHPLDKAGCAGCYFDGGSRRWAKRFNEFSSIDFRIYCKWKRCFAVGRGAGFYDFCESVIPDRNVKINE